MEKLSLEVEIGGRKYPLKVNVDDKEKVETLVTLINNKITKLKQMYTSRDMQDYLAMSLLQLTSNQISSSNDLNTKTTNSDLIDKLDELDSLLNL